MKEHKFPIIPEELIKILEEIYPPLEYSVDSTKEDWIFRGGQRDVLSKLQVIFNSQNKTQRENFDEELLQEQQLIQ